MDFALFLGVSSLVYGGLIVLGLAPHPYRVPKGHSLNRRLGIAQMLLGAGFLMLKLAPKLGIEIAIVACVLLMIGSFWLHFRTIRAIRRYEQQHALEH